MSFRTCGVVAVLISSALVACQKNDSERDPEMPVETSVNGTKASPDYEADHDHDDVKHGNGVKHGDRHHNENATEPSTNAADAVPGGSVSAVQSITQARCEREKRCENIGQGKKYDSMAKCSAEVREKWKGELDTRECKGGIVKKELDECLEEVRNENCNNPFDTLSRVIACREGDICKAID
jgi:hypothetical protein